MNSQTSDFTASASHISLMHRPYGPRMHLDEAAASAPVLGAGEAAPVVSGPVGDGEGITAAEAFEAYRKRKGSPVESAAPAATAENELPAPGNVDPEAGPDEIEEADAVDPPIERPKSWSKDEDAEWQSLPRATQQKIVARESERDTGTTRSQQKAAEAVKAAEAKVAQAEQVKQQYEAKLPALMTALHNINNTAFSDIKNQDDADLLAAVDPGRWAQWRSHQDRMVQANFELQQAESGKAAKHQSEWQALRNAEDAKATEKIPDLADKVKGPALMKRAGERLSELGFTSEELGDLVNGKSRLPIFHHSIQQLLKDSLDLADIRAATKAVPAPKTVPAVQRPGVQRPQGRNSDAVQASRSKLNESGDVNDAFALFKAKRAARRA